MLIYFLVPKLRFLPRNKERKRQLHTIHLSVLILCCLFAPEEGGDPSLLAGRSRALAQGLISLYGWGQSNLLLAGGLTYMRLLRESPVLDLEC